MSEAGDSSDLGWQPLPGGSWLFTGKQFADDRGRSYETCDLTNPPSATLKRFNVAQENLVDSEKAGCARGLHYQDGDFAQAKIVTLLRGSAQLLWLPLEQRSTVAEVHSVILDVPSRSLFTPDNCAHGVLALEDDTLFLLKMSSPIVIEARREFNLLSNRLAVAFARPVRVDLQSARDSSAPHWSPRRQDA